MTTNDDKAVERVEFDVRNTELRIGDTVRLSGEWGGKPIIVTIDRIQKDEGKLYSGGVFAFHHREVVEIISRGDEK